MKKKKVGGKLGPIAEKVVIPVETDAHKLVNYVCGSNINKTGEDIKVKCRFFIYSNECKKCQHSDQRRFGIS